VSLAERLHDTFPGSSTNWLFTDIVETLDKLKALIRASDDADT